MSWIYVSDRLTEDMPGTCTCMHLHAPEAAGTPRTSEENERGFPPTPPHPQRGVVSLKPKPKTYTYKTLRLPDLPFDVEWWAARAKEHPGVNLHLELEKAQEWSGVHKVKNAKLFFRNWLAKVKPDPDWVPSVDEQLAALKRR